MGMFLTPKSAMNVRFKLHVSNLVCHLEIVAVEMLNITTNIDIGPNCCCSSLQPICPVHYGFTFRS